MSDVVVGMLLAFGAILVAGLVFAIVMIVLDLRRTSAEIRKTSEEARKFLARASERLDQVVADVEEIKARIEPLTDPMRTTLENLAEASRGLQTFGSSLGRIGEQIPTRTLGAGARFGTLLPTLLSVLSLVAGVLKIRDRRKKGDSK